MAGLDKQQLRGIVVATAVAAAIYTGFRLLPTGTNLSHLDFRPGGSSVEMCDPANPQFIPVVSVKSPVSLTVSPASLTQGTEAALTFRLEAASGKPVGPADLAVTHTRRLHLLVISPELDDYQHLHPEPGTAPGLWQCTFTPRRAGTYRVFADFTPIATGRGLYGFTELTVAPTISTPVSSAPDRLAAEIARPEGPVRVNKRANLELVLRSPAGGPVTLEPVMDAFAHLVAFDAERTGYAHLHPLAAPDGSKPDALAPRLRFEVTFPRTGRYTIWAQYRESGYDQFRRFELEVLP
ncbi:hypothetical protein [Nibricoccus sp. IMCC34717]|uniref:hypothetical protein n=1 Tax=Nibricoccus sp. IMCC34717 TaxID=3034021 RepID=UPI00384D74A2